MDAEGGPAEKRWSDRLTAAARARSAGNAWTDPVPELRLIDFRRPWVLSLLGGFLGADRFYLRRPVSGLVKLLTLGGAGIWWAADVLAMALGSAVDGGGHPLAGRRGHRAAALGVSLMVILAAFTLASGPALTLLRAGAGSAMTALSSVLPTREPTPRWTEVAALAGGPGRPVPEPFTLAGGAARIKYTLDGPGFIYLLEEGAHGVPEDEEPLISRLEAGSGTHTQRVDPGEWTLVVLPAETRWSAIIERFTGGSIE
ncbi:TM2 domain-containing protein [Arthrobacter crusticola]|uniref:TM2 domain-containing protein n=1 Tax=Arthrobacter crusticola TaxID=2547960 RepID=A0A4R5TS29_9MICC|nr:TM2 domain-containing protein [Arthrobacter crusticola]TDK24107.1 TM2 domain-containing protein [Arthrobacter crusticola]